MVSFDLLEDYEAGGNEGGNWDDGWLLFVNIVPVVVTEAIEELPPLSRLTVD